MNDSEAIVHYCTHAYAYTNALLPETTRWAQWIVAARRGRGFPVVGATRRRRRLRGTSTGEGTCGPCRSSTRLAPPNALAGDNFSTIQIGAACNDGLTHRLRAAFSDHEAKRLRWESPGGVGPGWELYCDRPVYHLGPAMRPRRSSWSKSGPYR